MTVVKSQLPTQIVRREEGKKKLGKIRQRMNLEASARSKSHLFTARLNT